MDVEVTVTTWLIALAGLLMICSLTVLQVIALLKPLNNWTIQNVYGGNPEVTDARAYLAFNQGYAWADSIFWSPLQILGSVGMLLGERWGFLLALMASIPYCYSAITIFIWDRDLGFRQNSFTYWLFIWGIWPLFGLIEMIYCFVRLMNA